MASVCVRQSSSSAVYLLIVLLAPSVCSQYSRIIVVSNGNYSIGHNGSLATPIVFDSLDELASNTSVIANGTRVILMGDTFKLSKSLNIEMVSDFAFVSSTEFRAVVHCVSNDSSLLFRKVYRLTIANVSFVKCGAQYESTSFRSGQNLKLWSAIYIQNCTHVNISGIAVNQSYSFGIVIYDTNGSVAIANSAFDGNGAATGNVDGGGGVYVEFTSCPPGSSFYSDVDHSIRNRCIGEYNQNSTYTLQHCTFKGNEAFSSQHFIKRGGFRTFGQGGGLLVVVNGNAFGNSFFLSHSLFEDNCAVWGGGVHFFLTGAVAFGNISIVDCMFARNSVSQGGGGLTLYTYSSLGRSVTETNISSVYVARSRFICNNATDNAGGMLILISSPHFRNVRNIYSFQFMDCVWHGNSAWFSAAVDITSHHSTDVATGTFPKFTNCNFTSNFVTDQKTIIESKLATQIVVGKATFMVTYARAIFEKQVRFEDNFGSALYMGSGFAHFDSGTRAEFINNTGIMGGAVSLQSSSFIEVGQNVMFLFTNNTAMARGGAIYSYSISQHNLHHHTTSLGCFLHSRRKDNVTFVFSGNRVRSQTNTTYSRGHSVYATSLIACSAECNEGSSQLNASSLFNCSANFMFEDLSAEEQISGPGWNFILPHMNNFSVIPGKEFDLLFNVTDGLNNFVPSTMKAFIDERFDVVVDPAYSLHSGRRMKVHGRPGTNFLLKLERKGFRQLFLLLNLTLLECPPGFIYRKNASEHSSPIDRVGTCKCAWIDNYDGILRCSTSKFRAYIIRGFWAGYWNDNATDTNFRTARCPLNYCVYNASQLQITYLLPESANATELGDFICDQNRTGILCGSCIENHSVYFHSPKYKCGPDKNCEYGIFLYIVSELVPLTVIFVVVMVFNISFTSGALNGFILFAQVIDTFALDTYSLRDARLVDSIPAFMFIYGFFNLHFFSLDDLSFCLWKGAKTLDVIAFKYVTILFAFLLVLFAVLVMKFCNIARLCKVFKKRSYGSSVIHGLSTFLVMCFVQCVRVSFDILTPREIHGLNRSRQDVRVLISGDVKHFQGDHFFYAIPALLCLTVVVLIPLILLLWFPTGQKLLSFCGIGETKLPRMINKMLCVYRLTPLLDSFQSCFKDNYRFFAGLYFLYRYLSQVAFSFTTGLTQFYLIIELLLIVMLLLHAIAQPYKKRCYNIIDSLLFINLALINALSMFLHAKSTSKYYKFSVRLSSVTQAILIILPLLCCVAVILFRFGNLLKPYVTKPSRSHSTLHIEDSLPARLLDDASLERSGSETPLSPSELSSAKYRVLGDSQELQRL